MCTFNIISITFKKSIPVQVKNARVYKLNKSLLYIKNFFGMIIKPMDFLNIYLIDIYIKKSKLCKFHWFLTSNPLLTELSDPSRFFFLFFLPWFCFLDDNLLTCLCLEFDIPLSVCVLLLDVNKKAIRHKLSIHRKF